MSSRVVALGVTAVLIVVMFCCPPPAMAEQQRPKVMVCPITGEKCHTGESKCDPPPPQQFVAAPASTHPIVLPDVVTAPLATPDVVSHELRPAIFNFWSAPTRTIVLRI